MANFKLHCTLKLFRDKEIDDYWRYRFNYPNDELSKDGNYLKSDIAKGYITIYQFDTPFKIYFEDNLFLWKFADTPYNNGSDNEYNVSIERKYLDRKHFLNLQAIDPGNNNDYLAMKCGNLIFSFISVFWKYVDDTKREAYYLTIPMGEEFFQNTVENRKESNHIFYEGYACASGVFKVSVVDEASSATLPVSYIKNNNTREDIESKTSAGSENNDINEIKEKFMKKTYPYFTRDSSVSDINLYFQERHNGYWTLYSGMSPGMMSGNNSEEDKAKGILLDRGPVLLQVISHIEDGNGLCVQKMISKAGVSQRIGTITKGFVKWEKWYDNLKDFTDINNIMQSEVLDNIPEEKRKSYTFRYRDLSEEGFSNEELPKYKFKYRDKNGNIITRTGIHTLEKDFVYTLASVVDDKDNMKKVKKLLEKIKIYDDYVYDKEKQKIPRHILENEYPENYTFRYLGQVEYRDRNGELLSNEQVDRLFNSVVPPASSTGYDPHIIDRQRLWRWMSNRRGRQFLISSKENPLINGYFVKKPGVRIDIPGSKKERLGILKVYTYPQRAYEYKNHQFSKNKNGRHMAHNSTAPVGERGQNNAYAKIPKGKGFIYPHIFDEEARNDSSRAIPVERQDYLNKDRISRMYIYQELPVNEDYYISSKKISKGGWGSVSESQLNEELEDTLHLTQYIPNIFAIDDEVQDLSSYPIPEFVLEGREEGRPVDNEVNNVYAYRAIVPRFENPTDDAYGYYNISQTSYNRNEKVLPRTFGTTTGIRYLGKPHINFVVTKVNNYGWVNHRYVVARDMVSIEMPYDLTRNDRRNLSIKDIMDFQRIIKPTVNGLE